MTTKKADEPLPTVAPLETVEALVLRDYWVAGDEAGRVRAGTTIEVTKDELIAGMEKGLLARAK